MLSGSAAPVRSLYVHVPFCARKCPYCAFYSEPRRGALADRYVRALVKELELVAPDLAPVTVYFGGGTPSLLSRGQWQTILRAMDRLRLLGAVEWTIECNPATISLDKAKLWRDYGVNRISLGVQSLAPPLLERLGRIHTRRQALDSFTLLRRAGFENINLDLIFAIPGQTLALWRATLEETLALDSEHLSCYELTYEDDTPFFIQLGAGRHTRNEDLACAMYEELLEQAAFQGLAQYEVSNFAQRDPALVSDGVEIPARACRHNINYWRGGAYHGLGPSAASYAGGVRTKNIAHTERYCQALEAGRRALQEQDILSPLRRAGETAAFGLRMNAGWPFEQFQRVTGFDLRQDWRSEIATLLARGWAQADARRLWLTGQGLRFADAAAELFLR